MNPAALKGQLFAYEYSSKNLTEVVNIFPEITELGSERCEDGVERPKERYVSFSSCVIY